MSQRVTLRLSLEVFCESDASSAIQPPQKRGRSAGRNSGRKRKLATVEIESSEQESPAWKKTLTDQIFVTPKQLPPHLQSLDDWRQLPDHIQAQVTQFWATCCSALPITDRVIYRHKPEHQEEIRIVEDTPVGPSSSTSVSRGEDHHQEVQDSTTNGISIGYVPLSVWFSSYIPPVV